MPSLLPHGWYSLLPPVLATCGWISSLFQDGCDYARVEGSIVQSLASNSDAPFLEAGFEAYREPRYNPSSESWELQYSGTCLDYPSEPVDITTDAYWQISKFLDFAAVVLGGAGAFFLWFSTACIFSPGTWRWTGYEIFFASLFQGLSFLWFKNELCQHAGSDVEKEGTQCNFSWGAKMDVLAGVLWLLAALLIFAHYPQALDDWVDDDGDSSGDDSDMFDDDRRRQHPEETDFPLSLTGDEHILFPPKHLSTSASSQQLSGEDSHENKLEGTVARIV